MFLWLLMINSRRLASTVVNCASQMKRLNDTKQFCKAIALFDSQPQQQNSPFAVHQALKACLYLNDFERAKQIHNDLPQNLTSDNFIRTTLIALYMKCGEVSRAEQLFSGKDKDVFSFAAMMRGFNKNQMPEKAVHVFWQIEKPDEVILKIFFTACAQLGNKQALVFGNKVFSQMPIAYRRKNDVLEAALNMFIKCNDLKSAQSLFDEMHRSVIAFGSMMNMLNMNDEPERTLTLFEQMKEERIVPNEIIFTLLLGACSQIGDLSLSQSIFDQVPEDLRDNLMIQNSLIDMWGKAGATDEARRQFNTIKQPDRISFAALMNAYGLNGKGAQAMELFRTIPIGMIDGATYVCLLNACSHSGLVDEARAVFEKMPVQLKNYRVYTCVVDAFSRSSRFDEAQKLVQEYEKTHSPRVGMYMAMLSGTRNANNTILSHQLFNQLVTLFPNETRCHISATVLLANTYASSGDYATASALRKNITQEGMKKVTGLSRTVVDGEVVKFRAHDRSHPRSNEIYAELDRLAKELVEHGYKPDGSWITRPRMNDETEESVLCGHSERLAIAFNLIQRPVPTRIQVTKNLRVCGDCHAATKLIARIRQCSIIVRDANRIHHFSPNGQCSCGDYF